MHFKFSQDIEAILQRVSSQSLTLQDLLWITAERGFCLLIALLALPFLLPIPLPGLTGPAGITISLLAVQLMLGRHRPWLPKRIAQYSLPQEFAQKVLVKAKTIVRVIERLCRPRFLVWATNPYVWRINGFVLLWLTLLMILPVPGTNSLAAIGILSLSVSMLETDGILMCFAYGWTVAATGMIYVIGSQVLAILSNWLF